MVQVKICGITNLEDATVAVQAGADLLGFVFYGPSPRYIEPARAGDIIAALRERGGHCRFAGVFVNSPLHQVQTTIARAHLDLAQLHGSEPPELVRALSPCAFKALRPIHPDEARGLVAYYGPALPNNPAPTFMVDAYSAKQYGGTGERADWSIAAEIARSFPILLAGGLDPENVAAAIRAVEPWGVDVSSGVERAPGLKDHAKVRRFIAAAKKGEK